MKLYLQIMKRYLPSEDPKAVAHIYGMMAAYAMVDALKGAGKSPTRASLLRAAQHLNDRESVPPARPEGHDHADGLLPAREDIPRPLQARLLERPRQTAHDLVT